ncbi:hypothetical protein B0A49_04764 [Cryomyces minteri]|uniref:Uncharacterized protein n=1 Tax=Cryomyces minteri TaxID=331657 RepID=A0A4U0X373_9PEZI|nr:hypothetical protein B0A49_04764 [Cryomyces minteri]
MSRVIQDSDDDEDEASPLKPDHERHSLYNQQNARAGDDSTSPETRRSSANTSSTDILKRQIQDAQRELVGTTQNVEQLSPARLGLISSSTLAAMQRNKRRNSLTDMGSTEPPLKKPQRSKTVKTYASRQRRVEVDYTGGQLDALMQSQGSTHGGTTVMADQSTEDGTCTLQDIDGNGKLLAEASSGLTRSWGLPGSMAEQFAAHEPGAMFEDPSSTIPENTLEQQRLVEEALLANAERPAPRQEEDDPESVKENGTTSTVASQSSMVSKQQSEALRPLQEWSQRPPNELEAVEIIHMRPPDTKRKTRITKPVRSKTTIFEDHVGFGGNPPTASLQQQQALRKSSQASDTIEGGRDVRAQMAESSVAPTKGKRRRVVQLKEIDEYALEDASATEPPKKRGRGRPRSVQRPQEAQEEVTEVVVEDSATVDQQLSQSQLQEVEVNTASQKTTLDSRNVTSSETARSKELSGTPPNTAAESASSVAKPLTDATIMTPQKPGHATSPTSHSPLKASNKVPLRVGLSRRQRIPSLLRLVKK